MAESLHDVIRTGDVTNRDPHFPFAPSGWSQTDALALMRNEGLTANDDLWEVVRALQEYYARHQEAVTINTRELHDALDEKFHGKGGIRYLYQLLPGGPVAQGCRVAGLKPPAGTVDRGFGSVV
jgi:tRNA 2-thiouridine synthesizing protein E